MSDIKSGCILCGLALALPVMLNLAAWVYFDRRTKKYFDERCIFDEGDEKEVV